MAMKHFLTVYPKPEMTKTYTGLFATPIAHRHWDDRPNKRKDGVSYTLYSDAYEIDCGNGMSLFNFIHGKCGYFADYFHFVNPDWKVINMMRGDSWGNMIHSYCIKKFNGITYFADARGITDDPEVFFSDFSCSKNMYVEEQMLPAGTFFNEVSFAPEIKKAYEYIFRNEEIL